MSAGKYDILCEQGATLSRVFTWKDGAGAAINISGYAAAMQVRRTATESETILDCGGYLTLGGSAGTVTLAVPGTVTATLSPGAYVYDLELTSGAGVVTRLLQGAFRVSANVTR